MLLPISNNMAFNEKEQEIIKYGLENGKSQQEVMSAIAKMRSGIIPKPVIAPVEEKKPNYFQRVGQDYKKAGERITTGIQTSAKGIQEGDKTAGIEAGLRTVGSIAGATFAPILEAPGIKQATEAVVGGAMKIPVVQTLAQKGAELSQKYPNASKDIEDLINIATLGIGSTVEKPIANAVTDVAKGVKETAIKTGKSISTNIGKGVEKITPDSATIMNRVARLKPTDAKTFENLAGKTHGDYLVETGNFGTPDQIITKEAEKFAQSIKSVDKALASLPGTYKNGGVDDMLNKLMQRGLSTSTENVKAPYLAEVMELSAKNKAEGLSMSDINNVKRLYERHEKLGYNKMLNAKEVEQATYIDNAVREWQVQQAEKLGFTNLKELNKQTQLSRFIVNKLGDQVVGQSGLNGVGLTDWIMLSGGDPTAVSGFLVKKFFSSKSVQSRIAKMLSKKEATGQIVPKITPSKQTPQPQPKIKVKKASSKTIPQDETLVKSIQKAKASGQSFKYKTTVNIQDKNDLEYLGRILSQDNIADIKAGKMTNFRGTPYEDLARVNIISEKPKTVAQQLEGKIKNVELKKDTFYHGTSAENADNIIKSGFKTGAELPEDTFRGGGYGRIQNSISLTETPKDAYRFSELSKNGKIIEVKLKPNSKVISIEGIQDATDLEDYLSYLKKQKVDAVYIGGGEKELVIINKKAIKPIRSQLKAEWDKVKTKK